MPNDRQISQLVLQVDAQVAVAQRSLQDLARTVQQSAVQSNAALGSTDVSIGRTLTSHHQLGLAFNNARIAQTELTAAVTRSVDAYGAGASPLRILTTEMGRLTEAASFLGGSAGEGVLGKMVRFLGGPWGIALLLAGSVLAKVVSSHKEAGDSVDALVQKMRKQALEAANSRDADLIWQSSIEGLIDRNEKLIDTLKKRLKAEEDLDQEQLRQAQNDNQKAKADLSQQQTAKSNLERQLAIALKQGGGTGLGTNVGGPTEARIAALQSQISDVEQRIAVDKKAIGDTQGAILQSTIAVGEEEGKALADLGAAADLWAKRYTAALHVIETANNNALAGSTETISAGFYSLEKAMKDAASAGLGSQFYNARDAAKELGHELASGQLTAQQYADKMRGVAASLEDAVKAAKDAKKGTGEFGKQIGFADAEAIAKGAGLKVTSGYRQQFGHGTPGHATQEDLYNDPAYNRPGNPVARPGSSAHGGVNGKWALDIAFAPGLTPEKLKKLYGEQGVSLSAVYKENGHFHIEGSRSQAAGAENAAARAAQKEKTDNDQFARESAQLDAETLAARKQLVSGYDIQADMAAAEVEAQRQAARDAIQKQLDAKQITAEQAKILSIQADDRAAAQEAVIARRELVDSLDQQAKALDQAFGFQLDDLRFADEMAKTANEHRKIQLKIIDIAYKQKEADLQHLLDTLKSNSHYAESRDLQNQAAGLQAQIDRIPTDKAHAVAVTEKGTMGPLEAYNSELPHTLDDVKKRLDEIKVEGLKQLNDDLVSATTKALGLKGALGDVVGMLLKLGLDVAEGAILSALHVPKRASGGPVTAGQPYIVGENQPELFIPSSSGMILPRVPRISMARAANDAGPTYNIQQTFAPNFAGNAATREDLQQMGLMAKYGAIEAVRQDARRRARG
jgi:hypothetical protein